MSGTISKDLGGFQVMVAETDVKAFSAALGFPPDCLEVPLTYPMRMLADPMIASAIREALPDDGTIIHQAQRFVSHVPLEVDRTYRIDLKIEKSRSSDARLAVSGKIMDDTGQPVQDFATTLVIVQDR
jgi:hypothetical protein